MHEETIREFLASADWLAGDPAYGPLAVILTSQARELDAKPSASLYAEFGRTYRYALSLRPEAAPEVDPLEMLLRDAS